MERQRNAGQAFPHCASLHAGYTFAASSTAAIAHDTAIAKAAEDIRQQP
jgi:hypothetical protein